MSIYVIAPLVPSPSCPPPKSSARPILRAQNYPQSLIIIPETEYLLSHHRINSYSAINILITGRQPVLETENPVSRLQSSKPFFLPTTYQRHNHSSQLSYIHCILGSSQHSAHIAGVMANPQGKISENKDKHGAADSKDLQETTHTPFHLEIYLTITNPYHHLRSQANSRIACKADWAILCIRETQHPWQHRVSTQTLAQSALLTLLERRTSARTAAPSLTPQRARGHTRSSLVESVASGTAATRNALPYP